MIDFRDKRIGSFDVHIQYMLEQPRVTKRIMGKCLILSARQPTPDSPFIEYIAICDDFDQLEGIEGQKIPHYRIFIGKSSDGKLSFRFQKG